MSWFDRIRSRTRRAGVTGKGDRRSRRERRDEQIAAGRHLNEFATSHTGVEAFLEPATTLDHISILLVAGDGESTRRRIPDARWGRDFAARAQIPVFDALVSGYPQRLRDYNRRQKLRPDG